MSILHAYAAIYLHLRGLRQNSVVLQNESADIILAHTQVDRSDHRHATAKQCLVDISAQGRSLPE